MSTKLRLGLGLGFDDGLGGLGLPGTQHCLLLVHVQPFPHVGEGGLGFLGTQHFWVVCQYQANDKVSHGDV